MNIPDKELTQLVLSVKRSDEGAYKQLFERFNQEIFHFLLFKLKKQAPAEDLTQEVFLKIWKNRKTLNPERSIKSYLYTIANNLALNHIRDSSLHLSKAEEIASNSHEAPKTPESIFSNGELNQALARAIEGLTENERITFMMSKYEGHSYNEIAIRLSISAKTVESRMSSALKKLRLALRDVYNQG